MKLLAVAGCRGGARGARPPLIFRPKWGLKGRKFFFGDRGPQPYLKVWIRHWHDRISSLIKLVLVRFRSKLLYVTWGSPSPTTAMFSPNPLPSCPWHITPAFVFLSICFPFLSFYSSYTPLDPFPHPLSLFLFHLLSWAKPRNSLHTNSNYDDDDDANAAAADDDDYYSRRHFFIFLIIAKNVFHVSHSLSNNGVYPRLDIGQV